MSLYVTNFCPDSLHISAALIFDIGDLGPLTNEWSSLQMEFNSNMTYNNSTIFENVNGFAK